MWDRTNVGLALALAIVLAALGVLLVPGVRADGEDIATPPGVLVIHGEVFTVHTGQDEVGHTVQDAWGDDAGTYVAAPSGPMGPSMACGIWYQMTDCDCCPYGPGGQWDESCIWDCLIRRWIDEEPLIAD